MESKKTTNANLEKTKTMNWLMSAIVALALLFVSFEWGTTMTVFDYVPESGGEELLSPITFAEPPPPPPPPPPSAKIEVPEIINEVENNAPDDGGVDVGTEDSGDPLPPMPPNFGDYDDGGEMPSDDIFVIVETMPKFPGGDAAMMNFIAQSIKYPAAAIDRGLEGKVICSFVIDKDGTITDVEVLRGIDVSLDKEALRVIGQMPKWSPGMQRDKAVRVKYTLPISFRLQK